MLSGPLIGVTRGVVCGVRLGVPAFFAAAAAFLFLNSSSCGTTNAVAAVSLAERDLLYVNCGYSAGKQIYLDMSVSFFTQVTQS